MGKSGNSDPTRVGIENIFFKLIKCRGQLDKLVQITSKCSIQDYPNVDIEAIIQKYSLISDVSMIMRNQISCFGYC